jgi:transcriptional antiterminator NusG
MTTQPEANIEEETVLDEVIEDVIEHAEPTVSPEEADVEAIAAVTEAKEEAPAAAAPKGKGKRWYIIHAYTGFEQKVAAAIREEALRKGLSDSFEDVVVPTEEIVEVRRGKKVQAERKFFPGYVLAKMDMNDATWQLVKTTDKVAGFLGGNGRRPQPITDAEAAAIFSRVEEGVAAPKRAVSFEIGEQVKVIDGPFDSFIGVVEDIDDEKEKLKVSVSIFGRPTPVELEFNQVDKV